MEDTKIGYVAGQLHAGRGTFIVCLEATIRRHELRAVQINSQSVQPLVPARSLPLSPSVMRDGNGRQPSLGRSRAFSSEHPFCGSWPCTALHQVLEGAARSVIAPGPSTTFSRRIATRWGHVRCDVRCNGQRAAYSKRVRRKPRGLVAMRAQKV
ncbi:hypothetical protein FA95DRAFT_1395942 [Auriscalpium vulgare]|uniref:Uncharacterized protein n=1 Tax=Auriscalpium vulgare TaxID=40419 RepID=A0ACB8RS27_9AGAM|nr:hypothetical protein FA95DRAFT_1395942 [Auriscalpium vulgare]